MKPLLAILFCLPLAAQIEATDPGTGILLTSKILYGGKLIAAGTPRADAVQILGPVRVLQKPRETSSMSLAHDLERAASIVYHLDETLAMRAIRLGQTIPSPDESVRRITPAFERLVVPRCGVCWVELVERPLAKGESLRLILTGPTREFLTVGAVMLDKSANSYAADLYKSWTGRRNVYRGDLVTRITQSPGSVVAEDIDPDSGSVIRARD